MTALPGRILFTVALALAACGPTNPENPGDDIDAAVDSPSPHELRGILVTPTNPIIELDINQPGEQVFTALGTYLDGVSEDLTDRVVWNVVNPAVGSMAGPVLAIPAFSASTAEVSRITATFEGFTGEAQITVVAYRRSGPTQDFFFTLPFDDPAGTQARPLDFSTGIPALDVFFVMDTTGSMSGAISNLQSGLSGTVVPGIRAEVPDANFGVGGFEDFPISPWGSSGDQPFSLLQTITSSVPQAQAGVQALTLGGGNDWPESGIEALYQIATGEGINTPAPTSVPAASVGFRPGAMPVIVQITDAQMHGPGETSTCPLFGGTSAYTGPVGSAAHSRAQAVAALGNICARVVGIATIASGLEACSGQADLEQFATATGAMVTPEAWDVGVRPSGCAPGQCCTDMNGAGRAPDASGLCPVVFRAAGNGTGLSNAIVTGIRMLTRFASFDVTSERVGVTTDIDGGALPGSHTTADFLKMIVPNSFVPPPPPPNLPLPFFDTVAFHQVTPGTTVRFDVVAFNDFVPQSNEARIFRATIRVLAGGCTPLDEREVLILVPPTPIIID